MTPSTPANANEADIRALIEVRARGLRDKDAAAVLACGAPGSVLFSLAPPLKEESGDGAGLEAWFATWRGPIGHEIRDLTVVAGDDVAFAHSINRISGTKADGETSDIWFRTTLGLRKASGSWKIVHEHESVPFYMDGSLKAAVDLKP